MDNSNCGTNARLKTNLVMLHNPSHFAGGAHSQTHQDHPASIKNTNLFPSSSVNGQFCTPKEARLNRRLILSVKRKSYKANKDLRELPQIGPTKNRNSLPIQDLSSGRGDHPPTIQNAMSSPNMSTAPEFATPKEARLNRRIILSNKRKRCSHGQELREQHKKGRSNQYSRLPIGELYAGASSAKTSSIYPQARDFGPPTMTCKYCGAIMWYEERSKKSCKSKDPAFSLCCSDGRVTLPLLKETPHALKKLLEFNGGTLATHYQNNIRAFNAMFAFTSMGGNIDYSIVNSRGPYSFRLNGQNYHRIGSLLPPDGQQPRFAQLYIYDTKNEVSHRMRTICHNEESVKSHSDIVKKLVKMLDENNILVRSFRMARDRFKERDVRPMRLRLIGNRQIDGRQNNLPTASEVAAVFVGDFSAEHGGRDIIIQENSSGLQRISALHPSFMAMQYPLLFPYGEDGFRLGIKHTHRDGKVRNKETFVTLREYYAFRLQQRLHEGNTLLRGGRLFQQYVVDAYTCIEEARLMWIRNNQKKLRSDLYQGLKDAVLRGDTDPSSAGKRIYLPSTFTGSPRYMIENYQDAMAICRWAGYPDLFLTYTCNPKWNEISSYLASNPGEKPEARPDVVARVFNIKLDQFLHDLIKERHFGRVVAVIYTIEFQKRGLPHAHILLFLHPDDKDPSTTRIDEIISAEIPDSEIDPATYEAVKQFMMHGPCGEGNRSSPCMIDNKCSKHFPKNFCQQTTIDTDGYAIYCRKNDGRFIEKNGVKLDNRYVVPYNAALLVKYQAHINVEWCNRSRSIKYLFKYVTKGPDRATFVMHDDIPHAQMEDTPNDPPIIDEIKMFLQCRYVSASEACWRIFGFDIHDRDPAVKRLPFHLEDQQPVIFEDDDHLDNVLERPGIQETMFTEWMRANSLYKSARELTYVDFPTKWVWHQDTKEWKPRKSGRSIGRVYNAHPTSGEHFYLRMLLNVLKGVRSYKEMKTINGVEYPTYRATCYALGLLDSDKEWDDAINEASFWASGRQLRELFSTILLHCDVADPCSFWKRNWKALCEDILPRQRRILQHQTLKLNDHQLQNYAIAEIEEILMQNGHSLREFETMPLPDSLLLRNSNNRLIQEELHYDRRTMESDHVQLLQGLNSEQRKVYEAVVDSVLTNCGGLFFVYGHGGTGKTYLWRTLIARFRSAGKIVLAVASSGIAALLMNGGRTAHSRFSIPCNLNNESTCNIKQGTQLADLLVQASLIIWDEAPMAHRFCFEALDRSLRDILRFVDPECSYKPFGGKTVVLGGDFRQILPVVSKGRREDIVDAAINRSFLWSHCKIVKLIQNMRLEQTPGDAHAMEFAEWILHIGEGKLTDDNGQSWVNIPSDLLIPVTENKLDDIVRDVYPNLEGNYLDAKYLEERAILVATNEIVQSINDYMTDLIKSPEETYLSADSICKASTNTEDQDALYPIEFLNSLSFPGLPSHKLRLKVGLPVMLLRNLNQNAGLCNGTRMIITQLGERVIEARIITGTHVGQKVLIPRIVLSPSEAKWPFVLKRRQFPLSVCFAMTINKSQGQSLKRVGLFLSKPVFCHGQLYVAISRVTSRAGLRILISNEDSDIQSCTKNIVYKEVFSNLP